MAGAIVLAYGGVFFLIDTFDKMSEIYQVSIYED
jgi:DNA replicative helicase MCM subunit Mcm2 (Cdc46/Mcm family)